MGPDTTMLAGHRGADARHNFPRRCLFNLNEDRDACSGQSADWLTGGILADCSV